MDKTPGVGLSILVFNNKKQILLSKRLKDQNTMATPGGHVERFEELEDCCRRELLEETNLSLSKNDFRYLFFKNIVKKEKNYHYVDFFFCCWYPESQKVLNMEPDKHTDWEWFDLETVFKTDMNYFYGMEAFIAEMKTAENCCEYLMKALK